MNFFSNTPSILEALASGAASALAAQAHAARNATQQQSRSLERQMHNAGLGHFLNSKRPRRMRWSDLQQPQNGIEFDLVDGQLQPVKRYVIAEDL